MQKNRRSRGQRGQAIAEFVIGLVAVSAVFFGLLQVAQLGSANITNQQEARTEAEQSSLAGNSLSLDQTSIRNWDDGLDGLRHTADDRPLRAQLESLDRLTADLEGPLPIEWLESTYPATVRSQFTGALSSQTLAGAASIHRGRASTVVDLEPALQRLLSLRRDAIQLEDEVVMGSLQFQSFGN